MTREEIQNLILQMTLEEKAGMCSGADFWHLKGVERLGIPSVMVTDGPHGIRKSGTGSGSSWNQRERKSNLFPGRMCDSTSFDRDLILQTGRGFSDRNVRQWMSAQFLDLQ